MTYDNPPRYSYQPQPPRYERNGNGSSVSIRQISVPAVLVFIGGVTLFSCAYWLGTNLSDIKHSIEDMKKDLNGYVSQVSERIARVEQDIAKIQSNRWSIKDHDLWCMREEVANPNWKCVPSMPIGNQMQTGALQPQTFAPPSWNSQVQRD